MRWTLAALLVALLLPAAASAASLPIALGVNIAQAPDEAAVLQQYTKLVDRSPAIVMWYQQWSEPLYYPNQATNVRALGAVPLITWDPLENGAGISMAAIARGRYDRYIRASALAARSYRQLMYIRFAHEMNLPGSGFGPGDGPGDAPKDYVAAWRHVVTIFRRLRATNVEWVWSPNVDCAGKCPFSAFYPGDAWVDWVALDGYNYSAVDHTPWMSFDQVFGRSYRTLTRIAHRPVMIGETASASVGGDKAAWIRTAFAEIPRRYPRIRAVVWFDRNKETNWMVNSSPLTLLAWTAVTHSPAYAGTAATLAQVSPTRRDVNSRTAVHRRSGTHKKRGRHRHRGTRR